MKTAKTLPFMIAAAFGLVLSACSPAPGASPALPTVSLPAVSIDPSAATQAITTVLNELDAAIASNQTPTGLTAEEQAALEDLAAQLRTAVETGDLAAAQPAFDQLSAKVDEFAAKLNTDEGTTLKEAIAELRALLVAN